MYQKRRQLFFYQKKKILFKFLIFFFIFRINVGDGTQKQNFDVLQNNILSMKNEVKKYRY